MQEITINFYEGDLQLIQRAANLWDETVEDYIYDAALQRAEALLAKRKKKPVSK